MNLAPIDLVSAHRWERVTFTTYALSLSFFEAVVLDALIRGGARQALILADVQGVRASLSEQGAQRVGKDYNVEPVAVSSGRAFHPKISVFSDKDESHVLVGSGNLTFNGWGGNVEVLEHLHPSFAADAIAHTAEFFELLPVTERVRFGAEDDCAAIAADLRRSVQGKPANGNIRLLHNLDKSISSQLLQMVDDLGGATRLIAAAPFGFPLQLRLGCPDLHQPAFAPRQRFRQLIAAFALAVLCVLGLVHRCRAPQQRLSFPPLAPIPASRSVPAGVSDAPILSEQMRCFRAS